MRREKVSHEMRRREIIEGERNRILVRASVQTCPTFITPRKKVWSITEGFFSKEDNVGTDYNLKCLLWKYVFYGGTDF